ncbi:MAG: EamA family transporter [Pseudomonadota bacterium]
MNDPRQRRLLVLSLATVYLVWGTSYLATRVGVLHLPPLLFAGVRFLISGVLLMGVAFWRGFSIRQLDGHWGHLLMMSLLGVSVCNGLQVWAMQWVPSHTGALLNASSALWIVIFGLFGARSHRPETRAIAGLVIGFIGTVLLVWPAHQFTGAAAPAVATVTPLVPQLVILLACIVWSLGTIYMRNHSVKMDIFTMLGVQMLMGGLMLAVAGLLHGELHDWNWSRPGLLSLAYLVVFSSCFAYVAYAWLARHATPAVVGTYSYVNPALAALVGYVGLGERLTALQAAGALVILAGVLLINWPTRGTIQAF